MRVVSLLASGTEIVCALGAGDAIVGRSHECDNPEWVRRLPACTSSAFDVTRSSAAIDAEVKRRLNSGEPLYHVDADFIRQLEPDVLITQVHCDVCAVTPDDVARAGGAPRNTRVVALAASSVADIYEDIRRVAHALGREAAANALITAMQRRIETVTASVANRAAPSVVVLEWTDPVFTASNWAPELIEAAGGIPLVSDRDQHSRARPWEEVVAANPDYLIVAPCGFDLDRTLREVSVLEKLPGWATLPAVRDGRVAFADGNTYFNRSGVTIVETVEILAEILHADRIQPKWRGKAWQLSSDGVAGSHHSSLNAN
jgi:iron complex transport system substrate-binding protein